ncbi:MAG: TCR/Tet family MFS transporter [Bacteroidales bacterium]
MTKKHHASLGFIFITVLIDIIGIGIIIPVIPTLLETLSGKGLSEASQWGGFLLFSYAIMQFIFAPIMGELSDRFGRRKILLGALFLLGIDYIFHALAPNLIWLFIGRILAGIGGGSFTVATAYVADISTPEKKAQNFGMIGAAFGLGFILGPVIGGVFSEFGIRIPFYIAAGLTLLNLVYGFLILPESLPIEKRRKFNIKKANPIGALKYLKRNKTVANFALTYFFIFLANFAVQSTWSFFTMYQFKWDSQIVGYSLGVVGIMVAIVQGGLIRVSHKFIGTNRSIILGYIFTFIGLILFALANKSWMMFLFIIPYCIGGIAGPSLQSLMSNLSSEKEQGKLQGGLTCIMSITSIIGPVLMTNTFAFFTKSEEIHFPGAPFILGAIFILISLSIVIPTLKKIGNIEHNTK